MKRIIIVDDHAVVAAGLTNVLEKDPALNVVATAMSAREGLRLSKALSPDVILLDMRLPDANGPTIVAKFREACPSSRIIVLTGYGDSMKDDALRFGADDFLTKELASERLIAAVGGGQSPNAAWKLLSEREREVCQLAAAGSSNIQIAESLSVSPNTVKTHLAHAMEKLGVRNRTELSRCIRD